MNLSTGTRNKSAYEKPTEETYESLGKSLCHPSTPLLESLCQENKLLKDRVKELENKLKENREAKKVDNLRLQLEELQSKYDTELQKRRVIVRRVKKFVDWLKKEQGVYVEDIYRKLAIHQDLSGMKEKRGGSVLCSKDSFESGFKNRTHLLKNLRDPSPNMDLTTSHYRACSSGKQSQKPLSPNLHTRHSSNLNFSHISQNLNNTEVIDKAHEYINLRKDLKKETELVAKLRKLMMDTTHPGRYEYRHWPLVKHVWRWVKDLVTQSLIHDKTGYIK